jgi:hypothetical protein
MIINKIGFPAHICAGRPVNTPQADLQLSPTAIIVDKRLPCFLETEPGDTAVKICWDNNSPRIHAEPIEAMFLELFKGAIPYHE